MSEAENTDGEGEGCDEGAAVGEEIAIGPCRWIFAPGIRRWPEALNPAPFLVDEDRRILAADFKRDVVIFVTPT